MSKVVLSWAAILGTVTLSPGQVEATASSAPAFRAIDYAKLERRIAKEPVYAAKPLYALFVFGPQGRARMWAALDKSEARLDYYDVLYLDKNCNGDLTEKGERFVGGYNEKRARAGMALTIRVGKIAVPETDIVHEAFLISTIRKKGRTGIWFRMQWRGEVEISGGYGAVGTDTTAWTHSVSTAPVLRPTALGPLSFALYSWGAKRVTLPIGKSTKVYVMVGNGGSGPDTLCVLDEEFLDLAQDELWVTLIGHDTDGKEVRCRTRIREHC